MPVTIQDILRRHLDQFVAGHSRPAYQLQAAWRLRDCRTAAMGGHVIGCPHGHVQRIAYNSCRHRSCPQCSALERERWLASWQAKLLDCPHHHVVFTVPHELLPLWRYNKELFTSGLFWAASQALLELLADAKYLGARVGLLAALHTWGQTLCEHVHLHVLVTSGGLTERGSWKRSTRSSLLPRQVLMIKFRGKLRQRLLRLLKQGRLKLPPETSKTQVRSQLNKLGRTPWNVKILERYRHGRGVATYLARYLKGGPLPSQRLLSCRNGIVRFSYRDNRDRQSDRRRGKRKQLPLPVETFLSRLLEHVPPPNLHTVRAYGLYASSKQADLNEARKCLGQPAWFATATTVSWQDLCDRAGQGESARCPVCGERLAVLAMFPRGREPPRLSPLPMSQTSEQEAA